MSAQRSVSVAAVDLGASSGRVMLGEVGSDHLRLTAVARFANGPVRTPDGLHWDVLDLYRHALAGIRAAVDAAPEGLASVGVDSWAVDYACSGTVACSASPSTTATSGVGRRGPALVHDRVPAAELYARTGLQFLPFNTVYQLAADDWTSLADRLLLVPDLLAHWLSGVEVAERTNASTTGLLSVTSGTWDDELITRLGLPRGLLADLVDPGTTIGSLLPEAGEVVGAPGLPVVAVGSHDTASAVVGVPLDSAEAAYISLGTWGLVGLELETPVLTEAARAANFTHEGGVDETIRFLTNVMGTWLLSETLRTWDRSDLGPLLAAAADVTGPVTIFDVQDPRFVPPGDMPSRIATWCAEHDAAVPARRRVARAQHRGEPGRGVRRRAPHGWSAGRTGDPPGPRRRRRKPEHPAVPGDRRPGRAAGRRRPGRGHRARQRARPGPRGRGLTGGLDELRDLVRRTHDLRRHEPTPVARSA